MSQCPKPPSRPVTETWSVGIRTDLSAPEGHRQRVALSVREGEEEKLILLDPSSVSLITSFLNDLAAIILDSEREDIRPLFE